MLLNKKSMNGKQYKLVFTVPTTHADAVRKAVGEAGAGKIGNYSFCSFSTKGTGQFKPEQGANPTIRNNLHCRGVRYRYRSNQKSTPV